MSDPLIEEGGASISRAQPLRPSIPLHRHMLYGSGLTHSLDFVALLHIHYMCEDGKDFTVNDLVTSLRAEGLRNANGKGDGLIGSKAVYESVARLRNAGFLHRSQDNAGTFGKVSYTFYEFPTQNPLSTSSALPGSPLDVPVPLTGEAASGNHVSAGHTASPHKGSADRGSADRPSGESGVSAAQAASPHRGSGNAVPPTPPYREEEDSSSRKSSSATTVPAAAQATDAAEVSAAAEFLAELPGRWACGRRTAGELAPQLAEAASAQGWQLDSDLVQHLTRRSSARRAARSVLQERIEDLPRYRAARRALQQDRERAATARVPGQQLALEDGRPDPTAPVLPDGVTVERVEEAREFLLRLSAPWAVGPETAARLAPLLAVRTAERGWDFDALLHAQLTSNPGGAHNHELVLERNRIGMLPFRRTVAPGPAPAGRSARQEAIEACARCDAYGQYEVAGRTALCTHTETPADVQQPQAQPEEEPAPAVQDPPVERRNFADLLTAMRQSTV